MQRKSLPHETPIEEIARILAGGLVRLSAKRDRKSQALQRTRTGLVPPQERS